MPELTPVESSNIKAVGYDDATEELTVEFHNGSQYRYSQVDREVFEQLVKAPSVGGYFSLNVKGIFDFKRIK